RRGGGTCVVRRRARGGAGGRGGECRGSGRGPPTGRKIHDRRTADGAAARGSSACPAARRDSDQPKDGGQGQRQQRGGWGAHGIPFLAAATGALTRSVIATLTASAALSEHPVRIGRGQGGGRGGGARAVF